MLLSTMLIGTVSTVSAAGSKTVYLLDKASWGAGYAYCWSDSVENSGWPGVKMDVVGKQDGHTIYSYTPTKSYANVIFNNNNKEKQTTELTYPADSSNDRMYDNQSNKWVTYSTTKTLTTPVISWANGDDGYIPPKGKQTLSVTNTSAYESISGVTYELY